MSQEKAQLIAPIGIMTVSGMTATGVITATSFTGNIVGSAKSLVNGTDVTAGVVTGTSFVGNLTGNIQRLADSAPNINVGVTTATSFVGNLTGSVTDLTSQPAITVGLVTATSLSGPITGNVTGDVDGDVTGNVTGTIAGNVTGNVTGNATGTSGGLGINYNGGWTGAGTSQVRAGVVTATFFHGDGSNLDGVSSGPVSQQAVTIDGAATSINLSSGNLIYATQSANTTVSFANSENGNVYFIRVKDATDTARTITWPDRINWDGGIAPTLLQSAGDASLTTQTFLLVTRDMGVTWYGKELVNINALQGYSLWGWGENDDGQLGQNQAPSVSLSSPTQVPGSYNQQKGFWGVQSDRSLWLIGGYSSYTDFEGKKRSSPIQIGTDTNWDVLGGGRMTVKCTKTDGTYWNWGYNTYGPLGQNDRVDYSSPVQVPGTTWAAPISTNQGGGDVVGGGVKTDGTLWMWGYNTRGQLGQNDTVHRSSPVQVPGTNWSAAEGKLIGGIQATFAIKTDGTLWGWGENENHGWIGNVGTDYSSPTQIGANTNWSTVSTLSGYSFFGTKTDGTLWAWGYNNVGVLGQNDRTTYTSPRQVGTETTWRDVGGIDGASVGATKTDGTLWTWGDQDFGELGNNTSVQPRLSSPTQVPGTYAKIGGPIMYYGGWAFRAE